MAEEIVIRTVLDLSESGRKIQQDVSKALSSPGAQTAAKNAGKKIGESISLGIETGRGRASAEAKELAHQRRLETITLQSASRIQQIEARRQAQIDVIRERAAQREVDRLRRLEHSAQQFGDSLRNAVNRAALAVTALGVAGVAAVGLIGRAALQSAIDIDRMKSSLTALTGSAAAASARFSELVALAQKTPGLTVSLAAALDIQLRTLNTAEATINRILPVIGKLNAISPLSDPTRFAQNLGQLITQNFEVQDLRELVGQSPLAGELIKTVFGVNSAINGAAIRAAARRLGIDTTDELFTAMAKAAESHPALKNVTESMGTQFEKLRDRLSIALAPVGEQIARTLLPIFADLVKAVERYGDEAARVFEDNRTAIIAAGTELVQLGVEFARFAGQVARSPQVRDLFGKVSTESARVRDVLNSSGSERAKRLFGISKGPEQLAAEQRLRDTLPSGEHFLDFEARLLREAEEMRLRIEGGVGTGRTSRTGGGDAGGAARQRQLTELQRAVKDVGELRKQVEALRVGTGKLFEEELKLAQLEIEREKLKKERAQLAFVRTREAAGLPLPPQLPGGIGLRGIRVAIPGAPLVGGGPPASLFQDTGADRLDVERKREQEFNQRLRIQEAQITNQERAGLLTAAEAQRAMNAARAASRDEMIQTLEAQRDLIGANSVEGLQLTEQIESMQLLGIEYSNTTRFMVGFNSQIESSGDAFERFGQNVARAFGNVRDLFNSLKQAVLGFFNDILGQTLQNLVRGVLGPLFGGSGGGGFGNVFRSFAGGGGGGGISTPPSVSGATGIFANGAFARGLSGSSGGGGIFGGGGFSLSGIGGSFAAAAPLLGLSLGAGLGGQSIGGQILGAIGGGAAGIGASFGASVFGAGGGFGQAALAALGPIALIGAPLLIGAFFLGRAKRRRSDEQAAGEMLIQAQDAIRQLASGIASDSIDGSQARGIFDSQILGQFRQQIGTLKTKSVRESRLTNQVRDLRTFYGNVVEPEIAAQLVRRQNAITHGKLVPEFATGGLTRGGLALLHPNEMVLTLQQQSAIARMVGPSIFQAAGVPGVQQNAQFDRGGVMPSISPQPIEITIGWMIGKDDQTRMFVNAGSTPQGQTVIVNGIKMAQKDQELH